MSDKKLDWEFTFYWAATSCTDYTEKNAGLALTLNATVCHSDHTEGAEICLCGTIRIGTKQSFAIVQVLLKVHFLSIDFVVFEFLLAGVRHAIENSLHVECVDGVRRQRTLVHLPTFNTPQTATHSYITR